MQNITWKKQWLVAGAVLLLCAGCGQNDLRMGKTRFREGNNVGAIESFTRAIAANPKEQDAYFFRGATYSAMSKFDKAVIDYTQVIALNPGHTEAYWSRGYCYANMRMDDEAIADYTKSLKLDTQMKPVVYDLRAGAYFRKSMLKEAEADLKLVLQLKPGDQRATKGLEEIRRTKKAGPGFDPRALKFRPIEEQPAYGGVPPTPEQKAIHERFVNEVLRDPETKDRAIDEGLNWAWKLYHQRDYSTAMKRFNQVWLLDPENMEVYRGFAMVLRVWGYDEESREWERKSRPDDYQFRA